MIIWKRSFEGSKYFSYIALIISVFFIESQLRMDLIESILKTSKCLLNILGIQESNMRVILCEGIWRGRGTLARGDLADQTIILEAYRGYEKAT